MNFQAAYGLLHQACDHANPTVHHSTQANVDWPQYTHPHQPPQKIPAVGPTAKLQATSITQQTQMDTNLGKAHHFVHLKHDAVGPHHIEVRTDDSHTL